MKTKNPTIMQTKTQMQSHILPVRSAEWEYTEYTFVLFGAVGREH